MEVEERRWREEGEDVDEDEDEEVVVGRPEEEAWAAMASATGSVVSPSKNLAMAI